MKINYLPRYPAKATRSSWMLAICFTLCLSSCKKDPAPLPDKTTGTPTNTNPTTEQKALVKFDNDKDGTLSKTERDEMNQAFVNHFDTDGDNQLSDKEKGIARRRSKVTVVPSNPRSASPEAASAFLSRFDTNSDGKVSATEAGETRWKVMNRSDTDKDGLISSQEWHAANLRRQIRQRQTTAKK